MIIPDSIDELMTLVWMFVICITFLGLYDYVLTKRIAAKTSEKTAKILQYIGALALYLGMTCFCV